MSSARRRSSAIREPTCEFTKARLEYNNQWHSFRYVGHLDADYFLGDNNLRMAFECYGKITSVRLMRDKRGLSRGFGFVCFERAEDAITAMREMNGEMIGSKRLCVTPVCPSLSPRELDLDLFRTSSA